MTDLRRKVEESSGYPIYNKKKNGIPFITLTPSLFNLLNRSRGRVRHCRDPQVTSVRLRDRVGYAVGHHVTRFRSREDFFGRVSVEEEGRRSGSRSSTRYQEEREKEKESHLFHREVKRFRLWGEKIIFFLFFVRDRRDVLKGTQRWKGGGVLDFENQTEGE